MGNGVGNPSTIINGDEDYLYIMELPMRDPFDELGVSTVYMISYSDCLRWEGPTDDVAVE